MTWKIFLLIDDKREEIEYFIADKILKNIDNSTKIDELEERGLKVALETANLYLRQYNVSVIPVEVRESIAKATLNVLSKGNRLCKNN